MRAAYVNFVFVTTDLKRTNPGTSGNLVVVGTRDRDELDTNVVMLVGLTVEPLMLLLAVAVVLVVVVVVVESKGLLSFSSDDGSPSGVHLV